MNKTGRKLTPIEQKKYGKAKALRYVTGIDEPIYPIGYIQHKKPTDKKKSHNCYASEGRKGLHDNLQINVGLMLKLMRQQLYDKSVEYADNRISLFSAQNGRCAITGKEFVETSEIHCHHKVPRELGGTDEYANLILILEPVHKLLHATTPEAIEMYKTICNLNDKQMTKLNELRQKAGLQIIA